MVLKLHLVLYSLVAIYLLTIIDLLFLVSVMGGCDRRVLQLIFYILIILKVFFSYVDVIKSQKKVFHLTFKILMHLNYPCLRWM